MPPTDSPAQLQPDLDGRVYVDLVPAHRVPVPRRAVWPRLRVKDGVLHRAPGMDWKWDVFLHGAFMYIARSWTGRLVFRLKVRRLADRTELEEVEVDASCAEALGAGSPDQLARVAVELVEGLLFGAPDLEFAAGDILGSDAECLVTTANPGFLMNGGIGACLVRAAGPGFRAHVEERMRATFGFSIAPRGAVLVTGAGRLPFRHVLHVVAVDARYQTDHQVIAACVRDVLTLADRLGARSIALPALATGWGKLPFADCGIAMRTGYDATRPGLATLERVQVWTAGNRDLAALRNGWWDRW